MNEEVNLTLELDGRTYRVTAIFTEGELKQESDYDGGSFFDPGPYRSLRRTTLDLHAELRSDLTIVQR